MYRARHKRRQKKRLQPSSAWFFRIVLLAIKVIVSLSMTTPSYQNVEKCCTMAAMSQNMALVLPKGNTVQIFKNIRGVGVDTTRNMIFLFFKIFLLQC